MQCWNELIWFSLICVFVRACVLVWQYECIHMLLLRVKFLALTSTLIYFLSTAGSSHRGRGSKPYWMHTITTQQARL